jgi:7-cyano-7-deazaguanine synthase
MNARHGSRIEQDEGALVLFSGGQDSATCLAWALDRYARVETVGFFYGQRHAVELTCRTALRDGLRALPGGDRLGPDHMIDIASGMASLGQTSLTAETAIVMTEEGLPSTFVPGRNLLFLTYAAAIAYRRGLRRLVGGMCETDYSGYPDCRDDTLKALQVALNLGLQRRLVVETPLMWRDKAETWALAQRLGGDVLVRLIEEETHTCYLGDRSQRHPWGYGCGECPACELRADGWRRWRAGGVAVHDGGQTAGETDS